MSKKIHSFLLLIRVGHSCHQIWPGWQMRQSNCLYHHSLGKSNWEKPGSFLSSQYVLLLTQVSSPVFLWRQKERKREQGCSQWAAVQVTIVEDPVNPNTLSLPEKLWLVFQVFPFQLFPPLPLQLFYSLFLLLCSLQVSLLQQSASEIQTSLEK